MLHLPIYLLIKYILYTFIICISHGFMHTIAFLTIALTLTVSHLVARIPHIHTHTIVNGNVSNHLLHFCIPVRFYFLSTLFVLGRVPHTKTRNNTDNLQPKYLTCYCVCLYTVCAYFILCINYINIDKHTRSLSRSFFVFHLHSLYFLVPLFLSRSLIYGDAFNWKYCIYRVYTSANTHTNKGITMSH